MPGLTVNTSPSTQPSRGHSPRSPTSHSRSSSPTRPPYSPITPTLQPARLATATQHGAQPPKPTYTHTTQQTQTTITQPPPQPIDFESNPDVLALKASISILQVQRRNAENDIQALNQTKKRALADPDSFVQALSSGKLKHKADSLFAPEGDASDSEDEEGEGTGDGVADVGCTTPTAKSWPALPTPQNVVRQPAINWTQYGVIGESLDKLHADQKARPNEGKPQRIGADGTFVFSGEGPKRQADIGIAAPYTPGKDRIDKVKKGGKR
ncbi:hypothetical protein BP6252_01961 [Coleophoma cylindrospora]|uniref:Uncharacterized protein n=1 Tax=Coleophoma cylindrospora TaxID=1849047 RepID=A0A3D8SDX0_9HELO|nr:hypothetical protein BP6252_01961 [Coleophoma cylindrospora]